MRKIVAVAAFTTVFCQPAAAELYVGAKAGYLASHASQANGTVAASLALGYEFVDLFTADLAVEGEYTRSLKSGDITLPGSINSSWDYNSAGLFAAVRAPGPVYLKGRIGVVRNEFSAGGSTNDETGFAGGAGLGVSLVGLEMSVDWTHYFKGNNVDAVDYVSLGMRF